MNLKSLLSASALVALGMLAGRVLGLLREMLLAAQFGANGTADMAILLLIIPDFVTAAFIGSAASAVLVPAFAARAPSAAKILYRQSLKLTLAAFSAFAVVIFLAAPLIGWQVPLPALALALLALPLSAATAILTAWLQYRGRFLIPAFATVIFNTVIICCLLASPSLSLLAASITAAAALRLAAHSLASARLPQLSTTQSPSQLDLTLLKTYATTMGTGLLGLLPTYIPYAFIAAAGAGLALFNYALKLVLMPAMLLQAIVQLAVLPWLVSARNNRDAAALAKLHAQSLELATVTAIIAAGCLALCAQPVAILCFGYGKMTASDIAIVARSFSIGIFAMPAILAVTLLQSMLYAAGHARPAFIASIGQAVLILPLTALGQTTGQVPGVLAIFAFIQLVPLATLLPACRRFGLIPSKAFIGGLRALATSLALFTPAAFYLAHQEFFPILTIACAILIGIVSLMAAALAYWYDSKTKVK